jgi:hypothetical protein
VNPISLKASSGLNIQQIKDGLTFQHQADAAISQANPVSGTLYEVLPATENVRIISILARIDWETTQPEIWVKITIDGTVILHYSVAAVSAIAQAVLRSYAVDEAWQPLAPLGGEEANRPAFIYEGRNVKVEAYVVWAVTQPTPLVCRVKWAKR